MHHASQYWGSPHVGPWILIWCGSGIWIQRPLSIHTAWQRSGTVGEIHSSNAMRIVLAPCGAQARPYWIWIRDLNPVNLVSVPVWKAWILLYLTKWQNLASVLKLRIMWSCKMSSSNLKFSSLVVSVSLNIVFHACLQAMFQMSTYCVKTFFKKEVIIK